MVALIRAVLPLTCTLGSGVDTVPARCVVPMFPSQQRARTAGPRLYDLQAGTANYARSRSVNVCAMCNRMGHGGWGCLWCVAERTHG